ncbi:MAG: FAD-dependent oxidoreductase [Sulfurovaceae bacterium]|nr:FAD-dependent oxidoreductase [Sulfurovaceae bacterium]
MNKALILGGGFAGIEAAIFLKKQNIDVTLVSDRDYFYIYPTSIWIPTGDKTKEEVSVKLSDIAKAHNFNTIVNAVTNINAKEKKITLANGSILDTFKYIIVALGQEKVEIDGMKEHTLSICGKPEEAEEIKKRIDLLIKKDEGKISFGFGGNPKDKSTIRGGPAFEVMFNVHNQLKKLGLRDKFELAFFAPMASPGEKMGSKALSMIDKMFGMTKITKKVGSPIKSFDKNGINFADGTHLESDLTIFIGAGSGHSVIKSSDLPLSEAGFVLANEYGEVDGMSGVYAIGDSVMLLGENDWKAKQGHVAEIMARNVAHNIKNPKNKKSYIEHLNIICIMDTGDGAAFVYRSNTKAIMIPMPIIGHWLKLGWGWYCKNSKLGRIPRIAGI